MSRKKTSIVWRHFTVIEKNDVRCSLCCGVLKFSCGSTHNLIRHLRFKHKDVFTGSNTFSESVHEEIVKTEGEQSNTIEYSEIEGSKHYRSEVEESHIDESEIAHSEEVKTEIIQTDLVDCLKTETMPEVIISKPKGLKRPATSVTTPSHKRSKVYAHIPEETGHQKQPEVKIMQRQVEGVKSVLLQEENEFDAYGRIVALQLKQMPLKEALLAQELIHGILRKHRVKALDKEHYKNNRVTSGWNHGDHTYLQSASVSPDDVDDSDDM